jgi:acetyl-CoA acetyltransferase
VLKLDKLGFWHSDLNTADRLLNTINAIEIGRIVTRDIAGSDPERMTACNVLAYVQEIFKSTEIKVENLSLTEIKEKKLLNLTLYIKLTIKDKCNRGSA